MVQYQQVPLGVFVPLSLRLGQYIPQSGNGLPDAAHVGKWLLDLFFFCWLAFALLAGVPPPRK